jgi:hypothetical protein
MTSGALIVEELVPGLYLSGVAGGAKIEEYGSFVFSMRSAFIPLPRCRNCLISLQVKS